MFSIPKFSVVLLCALLALLGALSGCQSTTGKTAGQTMSDASITTAVQAKLTSDRLSNFPRIDVDTERGVVNLSGVVETEAQRARAERLALQVNGVVRVNNNLQIQNRLPSEKQTNPGHAQGMKTGQPERNSGYAEQKDMTMQTQGVPSIQGDVLRVECDTLLVKRSDGKDVRLHIDESTQMFGYVGPGERVEAKMNEQGHALSIRLAE